MIMNYCTVYSEMCGCSSLVTPVYMYGICLLFHLRTVYHVHIGYCCICVVEFRAAGTRESVPPTSTDG